MQCNQNGTECVISSAKTSLRKDKHYVIYFITVSIINIVTMFSILYSSRYFTHSLTITSPS